MTGKKFETYFLIQRSGITNMHDISTVCSLSNGLLTKEDCIDIMKNYDTYYERYYLKREEGQG